MKFNTFFEELRKAISKNLAQIEVSGKEYRQKKSAIDYSKIDHNNPNTIYKSACNMLSSGLSNNQLCLLISYVIKALSKIETKPVEDIERILKTVHDAISSKTIKPNNAICHAMIKSYVDCNRPLQAQAIFELARNDESNFISFDICYYNVFITAYADCKEPLKALETFKAAQTDRSVTIDDVTYHAIIGALINNNHDDETLFEIFNTYRKDNTIKKDIITYNKIIEAYAKNGNSKNAYYVFNAAIEDSTVKANEYTYTHLIEAQIQTQNAILATEIFEKAKKDSNIRIENTTLTILMKVLLAAGDVEKILSYINEAEKDETMELNLEFFNFIIKQLGELGKNNTENNQKKYVNTILTISKKIAANKKISPSDITHNKILKSLIDLGDNEAAITYYDEIEKNKTRVIDNNFYATLLAALRNTGDIQRMLQIFRQIKLDKIKLSAAIYSLMLSGLVDNGKIQQALQVYEEAITNKSIILEDTFYCYAIKTLFAAGMNKKARSLLSKVLNSPNIDNSMYTKLITRIDDVNIANIVYEKAQQDKNLQLDIIFYSAMLTVCSNSGDLDKADEVFQKMKNSPHLSPNINIYNQYISAYAKANDIKGMLTIYDALRKDTHVEIDADTYIIIINAFAENSLSIQALKFFIEAKTNKKIKTITYNCLLKALGKSGDIEHMLHVFSSMDYELISDITYLTVMHLLTNKNKIESTLNIFNQAKNNKNITIGIKHYTVLAKAYGKSNQCENLIALFKQLKEDNSIQLDTTSYQVFIKAFYQNNEMSYVNEVFQEAIKNSLIGRHSLIHFEYIISLAKCNNKEDAHQHLLKIINKNKFPNIINDNDAVAKVETFLNDMQIDDPDFKSRLYCSIIEGLSKIGHLNQALNIFESLKENNIANSWTYLAMIKELLNSNHIEKAIEVFYQAVKNNNVNYRSYNEMITSLWRLGYISESYTCFCEAIKNNKANTETYEIMNALFHDPQNSKEVLAFISHNTLDVQSLSELHAKEVNRLILDLELKTPITEPSATITKTSNNSSSHQKTSEAPNVINMSSNTKKQDNLLSSPTNTLKTCLDLEVKKSEACIEKEITTHVFQPQNKEITFQLIQTLISNNRTDEAKKMADHYCTLYAKNQNKKLRKRLRTVLKDHVIPQIDMYDNSQTIMNIGLTEKEQLELNAISKQIKINDFYIIKNFAETNNFILCNASEYDTKALKADGYISTKVNLSENTQYYILKKNDTVIYLWPNDITKIKEYLSFFPYSVCNIICNVDGKIVKAFSDLISLYTIQDYKNKVLRLRPLSNDSSFFDAQLPEPTTEGPENIFHYFLQRLANSQEALSISLDLRADLISFSKSQSNLMYETTYRFIKENSKGFTSLKKLNLLTPVFDFNISSPKDSNAERSSFLTFLEEKISKKHVQEKSISIDKPPVIEINDLKITNNYLKPNQAIKNHAQLFVERFLKIEENNFLINDFYLCKANKINATFTNKNLDKSLSNPYPIIAFSKALSIFNLKVNDKNTFIYSLSGIERENIKVLEDMDIKKAILEFKEHYIKNTIVNNHLSLDELCHQIDPSKANLDKIYKALKIDKDKKIDFYTLFDLLENETVEMSLQFEKTQDAKIKEMYQILKDFQCSILNTRKRKLEKLEVDFKKTWVEKKQTVEPWKPGNLFLFFVMLELYEVISDLNQDKNQTHFMIDPGHPDDKKLLENMLGMEIKTKCADQPVILYIKELLKNDSDVSNLSSITIKLGNYHPSNNSLMCASDKLNIKEIEVDNSNPMRTMFIQAPCKVCQSLKPELEKELSLNQKKLITKRNTITFFEQKPLSKPYEKQLGITIENQKSLGSVNQF